MKPLAGLTVLDFSRVLAGPMATQVLAALGAEVIKVERPGTGDESRHFEPRLPHGESAYFFAFNRGKRSLTLDLQAPRGREIARALAAEADVVVENFPPGKMDELGLGYETLAAANPALVYVSCTGFGATGPHRDRKGYDTIFQALSGITALTGHPDGPPAKAGIPISDLTSGLWIVIAVLAALAGRDANGDGCHVDLAMMDVQLSLLGLATARLFALDEDPPRTGTAHAGRVPSAAFETADGGWVQVSASDQHWPALCRALDLDDLANDEALRTNAGRVAARERVTAALARAIGRRPRDEVADAIRAVGVPAGEVRTVREALADAQVRAREMIGRFEHPTEGSFPAIRVPLPSVERTLAAPPLLGADSAAILSDRLRLAESDIASLRAEGVI